MKKFRGKKIISIFISIIMLISLMPLSVFATGATGTAVSTAEDLKTNLEAGTSVYLTSSIELSEEIDISQTATLDLNGQSITIKSDGKLTITAGSFTITDNLGTGHIQITESITSGSYVVGVSGGTVNIDNITMDGNNISATYNMIEATGGEVTIGSSAVIQNVNTSSQSLYAAIKLGGDSTCKVTLNGTIQNCVGGTKSGAVFINNPNATFEMGSTGIITNCSTSGDSASSPYGGGGIYITEGTANIGSGAQITGCSSVYSGGAIQVGSLGNLTVADGAIISGTVGNEGNGNAIYRNESESSNGTFSIGGGASITGDIYLDNTADKVSSSPLTITSTITNTLNFTLADTTGASTTILKGSDTYTLTDSDLANINILNEGYSTSLSDNVVTLKVVLTKIVTTETELTAALADDSYSIIQFGDDITISAKSGTTYRVKIARSVDIDFNGYDLTSADSSYGLLVDDNIDVNFYNSNTEEDTYIKGPGLFVQINSYTNSVTIGNDQGKIIIGSTDGTTQSRTSNALNINGGDIVIGENVSFTNITDSGMFLINVYQGYGCNVKFYGSIDNYTNTNSSGRIIYISGDGTGSGTFEMMEGSSITDSSVSGTAGAIRRGDANFIINDGVTISATDKNGYALYCEIDDIDNYFNLSGDATINGNIYLYNSSTTVPVNITSGLTSKLNFYWYKTANSTVLFKGTDTYALTSSDLANIGILNTGWYTILDTVNNQVSMSKTLYWKLELGDKVTLVSGDLSQTVTSGSAIKDIVISADSGYGFTNDYITSLEGTGLTVTRGEEDKQTITISGTPTANYTQAISATAQVNAVTPVFDADLVSATYDDGDSVAALDGTATTTDGGKITYKWYIKSYGGADFSAVSSNGTSATYTTTMTKGTQKYFYVVATNTIEDNGDGGTKTRTATSNIATINMDLDWPTFNTNLSTDEVVYYYTETAATLEVSASVDDGEITYQWYKGTDGTSWTAITEQTGTTYTPVTTSAGTTYYKCIATNTYNSKTMNTSSNIAKITVNEQVNAATPVFDADLVGATYERGETVTALDGTATVTDGGKVTYQWYDNNGELYNETGATYTPGNTNITYDGTYYVIVKNTITNNGDGGTKTVTIESNHVTVEIVPTTPIFSTDLDETEVTYYYSETPSDLTVKASASLGTLTYQWYKQGADDGEFVAIEGETSASYTPSTTLVGTTQYKCVAIHTHSGEISTADSKVATITVNAQVNAETPTITADLSTTEVSYDYGATITALDGTATVSDGGTLSYQWYKVDSDDGTEIEGAVSATYTPSNTKAGTYGYYVIVTNSISDNGDGGSKTATKTSNTATITVGIDTPNFDTDLSTGTVTYYYSQTATALEVVASVEDGGTLSYQWYKQGAYDSEFVAIEGETSASYTPDTTIVGTTYYKCVATNTNNENTKTKDSSVATITVNADVPNISTDLSETVQKETYGTTATDLTVSASVQDSGTISYQWYSKTTGEWAEISNATSASYTPLTNAIGTTYYKCVVTNTNGTSTSTTDSETATVTVEKATPTVTVEATKDDVSVVALTLDPVTFTDLGNYEDTYTITVTVEGVDGEIPKGTITIKNGTETIASNLEVGADGVATYAWKEVTADNYTLTAEFTATTNTNYTDATSDEVGYTIKKADQDISITVGTVTYGDDDFTLLVSETKESASLSYEVTSGTAVSIDDNGKVTIHSAGSVTIKVTSAETTNYNSGSESITFTVKQKALSVEIDDKEIVRGMSIPTYTSTVSGNVDSDVITVAYSNTADNMTSGDYTITMTNTSDYPNYDISVTTGTLTVEEGYTVSFDDTDVTDIAYGSTVSQPADPTKEGYVFRGWYLGDSKFDFTTAITGDLELTSTWEEAVEKEIETAGTADVVIDTAVEEQLLDELFTQEEIDLNVEMKVTVKVDIVEVTDMSEVTQTEFTSYLEEVQGDLAENETVTQAVVFDINVIKSLAGVDENITELETPIRITIEIPEEYLADGREFFILRNHDGEITILEDLDDDPTTITIETDRFSNYTLNYVESVEDDVTDIISVGSVATGDSTNVWLFLGLIIVCGLGIILMVVRRRSTK